MVDIYFVRILEEHNIYLPARWNELYISISTMNSNKLSYTYLLQNFNNYSYFLYKKNFFENNKNINIKDYFLI